MLSPVGQVSNLSGNSSIGAALPAQVPAALAMILATSRQGASEKEVGEFLRIALDRHIDLTQLAVVESGGRLMWAILPMGSAGSGGTLMLLSPSYLPEGTVPAIAAELIQSLCSDYRRRGFILAQVLLDPAASEVRNLYQQLNFAEIAQLIYLQAPVKRLRTPPSFPAGYYFESYSTQNHGLFAQAIRDSYQDSLDCPALNGLRDIEDVIRGHRAAGVAGGNSEFDPNLWRVLLLRQNGGPPLARGVLLLTRTDANTGMELVYIGLSPSARRLGLGSALVKHALATALQENRRVMTLAVDGRNEPALRLYFRHGFAKIGAKTAMIRDLRSLPPA